MLVVLEQLGAGFLGVTGPLGKQELEMLLGKKLQHPPIPGNSLLRFEFNLFVPGLFVDALYLFLEASRLKFLSYSSDFT